MDDDPFSLLEPSRLSRPPERRHRLTRKQERARVYGTASNDPMVSSKKKRERQKPPPKKPTDHRWYTAGVGTIPPGSLAGATKRFGPGALVLARRTAGDTALSAGYVPVSYEDLTDEYVPPLQASPTKYVAGPSAWSMRLWPRDAENVSGSKPKKNTTSEWFRHETTVADPAPDFGERAQMMGATRRAVQGHHRRLAMVAQLKVLLSESSPPRRPVSAPPGRRRRKEDLEDLKALGKHKLEHRPGTAVYCRRRELDKEAVRKVERRDARRDDHTHRLKWSLTYNLFRALEMHFQSRLDREIRSRTLEGTDPPEKIQRDVAVRLLEWIAQLVKFALRTDPQTTPRRRKSSAHLSNLRSTTSFLSNAQIKTLNRVDDSPPAYLLTRATFKTFVQWNSINFPSSMANTLWDILNSSGSKTGVSLFFFLGAFTLFLSARRPYETTLDTALGLYDVAKHLGMTTKVYDIFLIAAKNSIDRRFVRELVSLQLIPTLEKISAHNKRKQKRLLSKSSSSRSSKSSSSRSSKSSSSRSSAGGDFSSERDLFASTGSNILAAARRPTSLLSRPNLREALLQCPDLLHEFERQIHIAQSASLSPPLPIGDTCCVHDN